jgi:hypothetical protein
MPPYVSADPYVTSHFSHRDLLHELRSTAGRERASIAVVLSRIAEFDERQLFLREGYTSMHDFCVHELHYSDGAAFKRLTAARAARRFPLIFVAVADGRLHLSGIVMLSKYLAMGNPEALLRAAFFKTKDEIAQLIAERFPRPNLPERLEWLSPPSSVPATVEGPPSQLSPGTVQMTSLLSQPSTGLPITQLSPGTVEAPAPRGRMTPLAPQRVAFQFTGDEETGELYEQYRALVSHEIPSGEMALVYKDALRIAVAERTKRKFASTDRPGHSRESADPRHIPAAVKRAVSERDERRCTFVSESGKRCDERGFLEYDHAQPVARGGKSTVENIRLRCRAHNQFEAERAFGADFMDKKREEAKGKATAARAVAPTGSS